MGYQDLILDRQDGIATVTLNKPDKLNALSWRSWGELVAAVAECDADDGTKVIVVTGAGRGFTSGTDLTTGSDPTAPAAESEQTRGQKLRTRYLSAVSLLHAQKPTIAAVNGIAAGAGFSLALACDIRIAAASARFSAIFAKRGISPDLGCSYLLPRIVGIANALRLIYTGDIIGADEALRMGMVSEVVSDERLLERTYELAGSIARGPSLAIEISKRLGYREIEAEIDQHVQYEEYLQRLTRDTEDAAEGRRSFAERREPQFKGR